MIHVLPQNNLKIRRNMAKFAEKHLFEKILAKRHVDETF